MGSECTLESLPGQSATVHGLCPAGVLCTTNFVPDKIFIKYFLPLESFQESSGISWSCSAISGQRALLVLVTLFLIFAGTKINRVRAQFSLIFRNNWYLTPITNSRWKHAYWILKWHHKRVICEIEIVYKNPAWEKDVCKAPYYCCYWFIGSTKNKRGQTRF